MKPTPNFLKFWLPVFLGVSVASSVQADPMAFINGSYSVAYAQTTAGTTSPVQYTHSVGITVNDFGDFDPATRFPTSVSFSGPGFPGGQLDVDVLYNSPTTTTVTGANYYGVAGGGIYGAAPFAGGYMWGSGGTWSPHFSDVSGPLSATLHGGALDGYTQSTIPFDLDLLPNAPLFTLGSLEALANLTENQDLAMTLVLPFSPGFTTTYGFSEIVNGTSVGLLNVELDPILNPTGFSIAASLLLPGHDYILFVSQSTTPPPTGGNFNFYQAYNSVAFSVAASSVPDGSAAVVLFGSALLGLGLVRRRLAA